MIGTKLAHYEITSHLGSGGMGDVYQAMDSKLGRSVAIKLLPAAFASDPERLARFRREAQVLASLNHPNIAHIYGLEECGDTSCIVMELVEGETLQARIRRGPVGVDEALTIGTINGAYASSEEQLKGSITARKLADFVFLEKDPHDVPPNEIISIKVNRTVVGGRTVFPKQNS